MDQNFQPHLYLDVDSANGGSGSIFPATYFDQGLAAGFISFKYGIVDSGDYVLWRKMSGQQVARGTSADGNGDGNIDNVDYQLWRTNFGSTLAGAAAGAGLNAVPEPSAASLFILISYSFSIVQCLNRASRRSHNG